MWITPVHSKMFPLKQELKSFGEFSGQSEAEPSHRHDYILGQCSWPKLVSEFTCLPQSDSHDTTNHYVQLIRGYYKKLSTRNMRQIN